MIKPSLFLFLFASFLFTNNALKAQQKTLPKPKLVVGIVIDQMRWDYLYRFYDRYGNDGFKRLMNEGFNCGQAYLDYVPAFTGPGHACIYSGSVPSIHGIAANDWIDTRTQRHWYCVEDTDAVTVGGSNLAGKMSPKNLLTTTVTDELKLATNQRSRVFAISLKDRGSILPGGHLANGAYWFDDSTGNFISSNYYGDVLPQWLMDFNRKRLPDSFLKKNWEPLYPINTYKQSIADENDFEGFFKGEKISTFPHRTDKFKNYLNLRKIPAGNTFSFEAAKACINGENMGGKSFTDFFCLSLSSSDYIGHQFAPNSTEVEDMYLRLDEELAAFLNFLDKKVGRDNYTFFLTADHGAAQNARFLESIKIPAGNFSEFRLHQELDSLLSKTFKKDSLVLGVDNYQIYLNNAAINRAGISRKKLKDALREFLFSKPEIAYVADLEDMNAAPIPQSIARMIVNGYHRTRSGSIQIILNPGWLNGYGNTGTAHGTWHPYDAHIPLLFYGWGIKKGSSERRVNMQDIAPTISSLLKIQVPDGCIGEVISEVLKK